MRRALSISLILLLWLPAVAALMPGAGDASLPFCCRRQGAHHCAMDAGAATPGDGSGPAVHAPSRCPQFPNLPATVSPTSIAAVAQADGLPMVVGFYSPFARRDAIRAGRKRVQLDRGPPASALA